MESKSELVEETITSAIRKQAHTRRLLKAAGRNPSVHPDKPYPNRFPLGPENLAELEAFAFRHYLWPPRKNGGDK